MIEREIEDRLVEKSGLDEHEMLITGRYVRFHRGTDEWPRTGSDGHSHQGIKTILCVDETLPVGELCRSSVSPSGGADDLSREG